MTEFPTFERLAEEHQRETAKEQDRRRVGQVVGVVFFLLCVLEILLLGPHSSRTQKQLEGDLADLQLPSQAVQEGYKSDYQTRHGYAERLFASSLPPQAICDFYIPELQGKGWSLKREECEPTNVAGTRSSRILLELVKAHSVARVSYLGFTSGKSRYSVRMEWLD